jgi:hypothetical protein
MMNVLLLEDLYVAVVVAVVEEGELRTAPSLSIMNPLPPSLQFRPVLRLLKYRVIEVPLYLRIRRFLSLFAEVRVQQLQLPQMLMLLLLLL